MDDLKTLLEGQKNKKLLAVFAHPDDETMGAGDIFVIAKQLGYKITLLVLTQGGAGQMHIHPRGKTVKQVRKLELEKAVKTLRIDKLILKDFDDGKLREQTDSWIPEVKQAIGEVEPSVVVTFDPSGWTGHPDHIISCVETKKMLEKKSVVLLWPVIDPDGKKWMNKKVKSSMPEANCHARLSMAQRLTLYKAGTAYKSQRFSDKKVMPTLRIILGWREGWYHKVDLKKVYPYKFIDFEI